MEALNLIETQQGLNEVVVNKVHRMLASKSESVAVTVKAMMEEGAAMQDYIAPLGISMQGSKPMVNFDANGTVKMVMPEGTFALHDNAVAQLAEKMSVPVKYLRQLAAGGEWERQLAATILNEHSNWSKRSRVLVRAVGNEVRGVLSDSYRRLNSMDIAGAFLQEIQAQGAQIADAYKSDTKVWFETILPNPISVPTKKNGIVTLFAGARFSTSDFGNGSVDMRSFLLNGICLNGMVRESVMKQVHLGSKLPDSLHLSNETYRLDTAATVSAVRDITKGLFGNDALMRKAIEIQGASEIDVDFSAELKALTYKAALLKDEAKGVEKLLMDNNPEDGLQGGATLWKLTQAITAHARDLEPSRSRELHELSGQLMNRVKLN